MHGGASHLFFFFPINSTKGFFSFDENLIGLFPPTFFSGSCTLILDDDLWVPENMKNRYLKANTPHFDKATAPSLPFDQEF